MVEWQKKFGKQGLVIVAFSHMPAQMQGDLAKGMGINYTLAVWDKDKFPKPISLVKGYPTSLLIDRQGRFRTVVMGPMLDQLEKELMAALKEKPPTKASGAASAKSNR